MNDDVNKKPHAKLDEVGGGKLPISGRFVKGKSGNPRGRPKKAAPKSSLDTTVRDRFLHQADRLVSIREGENVLQVPLSDAIQRAETVAALKGNTHAQRNFLEREARYRSERSAAIEEDHRFWRDYCTRYKNLVADGSLPGPALDELPHPDDLVFETGKPVMIRGGDPVEAARIRKLCMQLRDLFMLQWEKDARHFRVTTGKSRQQAPLLTSAYIAVSLNDMLPKRLQLNDTEFLLRLSRIRALRNRELEKQLRREWAEVGAPKGRLGVMPPIEPVLAHLGIEYRGHGKPPRYRACDAGTQSHVLSKSAGRR